MSGARTILLVDDEPDIVDTVALLLSLEGYEVKKAGDGRAALQFARAGGVDLVVTDLMMPRMGGEELCRCLKHDPQTAGIPIVMSSAALGAADAASQLGCAAFLPKPARFERLLGVIRSLLGSDHDGGAGGAA
ncbi:response regulator [Caldimonas brevitalea]|uniref:Response regulator receiver:ATP-binding region n=1 Tax=Caldimonas brevitalea TaxID=413882 RepID=A0A0G3BDA2_9BURK|nr:response regulator [Caldimonas brevitalea]AKJ27359.1 response regulator receiver:ATP-binding region [Caldimonas brevitalea]